MRTLDALIAAAVLTVTASTVAESQEPVRVDTKGVTARILFEAAINGGHVPELHDRYKLRVTEITMAAGGYVGDHNHLGPGIRQMAAGSMIYILPDTTLTDGQGDYFFETGDVSHRVESPRPSTRLLFEILPVDVSGPSLIRPRDGRPRP